MTTVMKPSGEARDTVLYSRIQLVYLEFRRAGTIPSLDVCAVLARQPCSTEEFGQLVGKVLTVARAKNQPLTQRLVDFVMQEQAKPKPQKQLAQEAVLEATAERFLVTVDELKGPGRTQHVALARQVAMFLLRESCDLSTTKIGKLLGDRDHSTVVYGQAIIEDRYNNDPRLRLDIEEIKARLLRT